MNANNDDKVPIINKSAIVGAVQTKSNDVPIPMTVKDKGEIDDDAQPSFATGIAFGVSLVV